LPRAVLLRQRATRSPLYPYTTLFRSNGVALGLVLLLFVGLFKFPDQVIGVMAGPFYLDSGFSKADIATVSKIFGIWMGIGGAFLDRKSTRLNSSHVKISYAVFCLKKK